MLTKRKGFTLIEIVIVLAIAALIMVIVFLAVQGANRARRDTARKDAANRVLGFLENSASNNNGDYPGNQAQADVFKTDYVANQNVKDPQTGAVYTITYGFGTTPAGVIRIARNARCGTGDTAGEIVGSLGGTRLVAVQVDQEGGKSYCVQN